MTNQISLKRIQKNFFQTVDKCVLVTSKYDLHGGRPRIIENDPYTSIVLYFGSDIISVLIVLYFYSNSFFITLFLLIFFDSYKKLEGFSG